VPAEEIGTIAVYDDYTTVDLPFTFLELLEGIDHPKLKGKSVKVGRYTLGDMKHKAEAVRKSQLGVRDKKALSKLARKAKPKADAPEDDLPQSKPKVKLKDADAPATRTAKGAPDRPDRPKAKAGDRPKTGDRDKVKSGDRPKTGDRDKTKSGDRPKTGDRDKTKGKEFSKDKDFAKDKPKTKNKDRDKDRPKSAPTTGGDRPGRGGKVKAMGPQDPNKKRASAAGSGKSSAAGDKPKANDNRSKRSPGKPKIDAPIAKRGDKGGGGRPKR
jgi:transcription termination factor Rho